MTDFPFKNLGDAKEYFVEQSEKIAELEKKAAVSDQVSAENSTLKAKVAALTTENTELKSDLGNASAESVAKLAERDKTIAALNGEKTLLETSVTVLQKNQKTVAATAREIVAASGGAPAPVDNSEVELTSVEFLKSVANESDPQKIFAMYGKHKASKGK